ncbi:hypothetical protein [Mesorhizobium escarrei]|uniref:Uncharacterized protein n=1 Tax=Mesorhizobium escarrei TaxID=666018 RepID=A0ABM9EJ05_9HYPH|nr:hypothetical protein [Mesorhizobium escarrei]CAH2408851.1 hypothetical protein MES5069_740004 [Mesorhizobium escarrei]
MLPNLKARRGGDGLPTIDALKAKLFGVLQLSGQAKISEADLCVPLSQAPSPEQMTSSRTHA